MNTLIIVLIAACCLVAGYVFYGRWLANKWGIDPKAKTPAVTKNDGQDYVPTDGWVVFAHQFSSIAGAVVGLVVAHPTMNLPAYTGFLEMFGIPVYVAQCFMTMCVSALALTSLDSVARIGRMSFQELLFKKSSKK